MPRRRPMKIKKDRHAPSVHKTFGGGGGLFGGLGYDPSYMTSKQRAENAFEHHVWVYAAAMAVAINGGQAPWRIYRETPDQLQARRDRAVRTKGSFTGPAYGTQRRALQRHLQGRPRLLRKGLEIDELHPLNEILYRPNPYQSGSQLQQSLLLTLAVRGESFWFLSDDDNLPASPVNFTRIWPIDPRLMAEQFEFGYSGGDLIGFKMRIPPYLKRPGFNTETFVPLESTVHFKLPSITTIMRGTSPLLPAQSELLLDMMMADHDANMFKRGAKLSGVLSTPYAMDAQEEQKLEQKWNERFSGPQNAGRTAVLHGDLKYTPTEQTRAELRTFEQLEWNRDATLATIGVPRTVVGITESVNYATQLGQDRNFWEKRLIPIMTMIEQTVDATIMFTQPDDVVIAFDYSGIEALRVGISEAIDAANRAASTALRMPPRVAFELVGLEVPDYDGIDQSFASSISSTIPESDPESSDDENETVPTDDASEERRRQKNSKGGFKRTNWNDFVALQGAFEDPYGKRWKAWVGTEKRIALELFDEATSSSRKNLGDLTRVLPTLDESKRRLRGRVRPLFGSILERTYEFTVSEVGGVPVFQIDDQTLLQYMNSREDMFVNTVSERIHSTLLTELTDGIASNDSFADLRKRIARVYDINRSDAKTLQIARTETGSLINGIRDEMFIAQGFEEAEWLSADDEVVRVDHISFQELGPQKFGVNYLDLIGKGGTLRHPGDPVAPPEQTINCRCFRVPV